MKDASSRDLIQFFVRMELYGKKFFIYGNCMIKPFGQPERFLQLKLM